MPRKLFDADNNEIEVPTEEEIKALEEKAKKADEPEDKNWKETRGLLSSRSKMKKNMEELGFTVDEEGNVTKKPEEVKQVSQEEINSTAEKAARRVLAARAFEKSLGRVPEKERDEVKKVFEALKGDKDLDEEETEKLFSYSSNAVNPNRAKDMARETYNSGGTSQGPKFDDPDAVSDGAKEMGRHFNIKEEKLKSEEGVSDLILKK